MFSNKTPLDTLYKPVSFDVKINGLLLSSDYEIHSIKTYKEVNKLSRAVITIYGGNSSKNTFDESENTIFDLGKEVEIKMGYEQNNDLVFQGIIENHRISLKEGFKNVKERSLLIITCVDKAIGLVNNYTTEVFKESSDSEIIASLTNKISGLSTNIESTSYEHPCFPKYNNCDWNFIKDRANYNGQFLINSNNQLAIKTPVLSTYLSNLTIINGQGTISFEASINGTNQIDSLGINQSNSYTGEETSKTGNVPDSLVESSSSSKSLNLNSDRSIQLNISQDMDPNEISILADSMLRQNNLERIQGKAKFRGVLDVDLDQVVTLEGFGARFDGDVYITAVNHQIEDGQIFTAIEFGIKNNLIKPNIELDLIPKSSFISGLHIGEITQIDEDPDNQFRVKVLVPALNEFSDGIWARLSHFYTVSEGGLFFFPEIGTKVILSFISNDSKFPIVLGSLYSSEQQPDTTPTSDNNLKSLITKSKLKIEFNEEDKSIELSTPNQNMVKLNETEKEILIQDENNNSIKLSENGIELNSEGDIKISCSGTLELSADGQIQINSTTSDVNIEALNISQNANAEYKVEATASLELNTSGVSKIQGSIVQIN